ncbi:chemotaxis regulator, protein-glutamate methyltransferase [Burkholderiales bacterium]|nr:chemotaxis regulator, protein-glutamate methyltransferase [Burkholderiales bacterium]
MGARDHLTPPADPGTNAAVDDREYGFLEKDFRRVRRLIYRRAGIHLSEHKQNMVYSRLSRRLRVHGMESFTEYLDRLEADAQFGAAEEQEFVNALTTNLTSFFREAHHFPVLEEFLRNRASPAPPLVWCAAASTGEEPYSIAIAMSEAAGSRPAGSLLATDIDTNVLATAAGATYRLEAAQVCGEGRLRRFFLRGAGANEGMVRVRPELSQLVRFAQLNLLDEEWPLLRSFSPQLDAVFCRNVMIYFDRKTQKEILHRMVRLIRPGGLLFVGHSENFTDCHESLSLRGKTVYQRK